jgi:hypothetical protein
MPEHSCRAVADAQRGGEVSQIPPALEFEVDEPPAATREPVDGAKQIVELLVRPSLWMTTGGLDLEPRS